MADLNLDTAEPFNVTMPFGELIDVRLDATDTANAPVNLTGVWFIDIYNQDGDKVLPMTAGAGFDITGNSITIHFGYILTKLKKPDDYHWRARKVEDGLSAPIWKGYFIITKP